jgi:hypothetical protein
VHFVDAVPSPIAVLTFGTHTVHNVNQRCPDRSR